MSSYEIAYTLIYMLQTSDEKLHGLYLLVACFMSGLRLQRRSYQTLLLTIAKIVLEVWMSVPLQRKLLLLRSKWSVPPTINSTLEDDCDGGGDDNGGDAYFHGDVDDIGDKNTYDCQRVHVRGSDYSTAIALTGTASCPQWW